MKKLLLLLLIVVNAHALFSFEDIFPGLYKGGYIIGNLSPQAIDFNKTTHILVAGTAKDKESNQFFQSSLLRAYKYQELYPNHQVVFISSPEVKKKKNREVFEQFNVTIIEEVEKKKLTGRVLVEFMSRFEKIASFDFYGHSSPWAIKLGKKNSTLEPSYASSANFMAQLASKFTANAYATLNGCNAGFLMAGPLSKLWQVPVSAALTGSLFEGLFDDSHWYSIHTQGNRSKPSSNAFSLDSDRSCSEGACWRMKPQNTAYKGYWGEFDSGLGFYKFFCDFDNSNSKCERAMAISLLSFPSSISINKNSSLNDFKRVALEYICPTGLKDSKFNNCQKGIEDAVSRGDLVHNSFDGNALSCNFKKCDFEFKCDYRSSGAPKVGSCRLTAPKNSAPTAEAQEYLSLIKGFKALK
jgi:hypothetical protein